MSKQTFLIYWIFALYFPFCMRPHDARSSVTIFNSLEAPITSTGWQSISVIIYCFTVTSFWVLVTFWAYRRLTRCGPFDKIALWSLLMPIWDHLSLVSKETIFRRCTNFSDFCNIWKTISDDNSQKNWMTQWFMRMMECFLLTANHE